MRRWLITSALLALSIACGSHADASRLVLEGDADKPLRQRQFARLVAYRFEAIETAFGPLSSTMNERVDIVFKRDKDYAQGETIFATTYDAKRNELAFSSRVLYQALPGPNLRAVQYWPFYDNPLMREDFPIVELIDTALWDAFLQEAASTTGHDWPGKECSSPEIQKRLPCRMVLRGMLEHIQQLRQPLFNENRTDRILPENYAEFCNRKLRADSREYEDVERYGGILLLKPLIVEFGIPRTFAYAARTPFSVEENNMKTSVRRYQERARAALAW